MKLFSKFAYLISIGVLFMAVAACSSSEGSSNKNALNTVTNIATVKTTWQAMSDQFDQGKASYAQNRNFFTVPEQKVIDEALQAMNQSRALLKHIEEAESTNKLLASTRFIVAYSDAKKGYLLIRTILHRRYDQLSVDNQKRFNHFDAQAIAHDKSVYSLIPGETSKRLNSLISLGAQLLTIAKA